MKLSEKILGAIAMVIAVAMLTAALPVLAKDEYRSGQNTVSTEVTMSPTVRGDEALPGIISKTVLKTAVLSVLFPDPVFWPAVYLLITSAA